MKQLQLVAWLGVPLVVAGLSLASPLRAQQGGDGAPQQQVPVSPPAPAVRAQTSPSATPALPSAPANETQPDRAQATPAPAEVPVVGTEGGNKPPKAATSTLHELSPWSMFLAADVLVKAVMVSLAFASVVTWTILIAKVIELFLARRRLNAALALVGHAKSLMEAQSALTATGGVLAVLLAAAANELQLSPDNSAESGVKERVASRCAEIVKMQSREVRRGMGALATIGATSPFVGLFGTVWGIMNSFIGISKSQTTNLAVVAPGIAEALLATAFGLAAAIQAVIIYNHFSRETRGYLELVGRASGAVGRLLSRDIDRTHGRIVSRAAE